MYDMHMETDFEVEGTSSLAFGPLTPSLVMWHYHPTPSKLGVDAT
jgi:hypothetical protein